MESERNKGHELLAAGFIGMGIIVGLESLFCITTRFKRWRGLYFWSMVMATLGALTFSISNIFALWVPIPALVLAFQVPAWFTFGIFQFLILYSRLHLLSASQRLLRIVLFAIIFESCTVLLPMSLSRIVTLLDSSPRTVHILRIWWIVAPVIYALLEVALSITYIVHVRKVWHQNADPDDKRALRSLIYMCIFLIVSDITINIVGLT